MIKGIDVQLTANRAAEYSKDVSSVLRRDELRGEFAHQLNQVETDQMMHSVTELEEMRGKRINADDDGGNAAGQENRKQQKKKESGFDPKLPSVGDTEQRLLDIQV